MRGALVDAVSGRVLARSIERAAGATGRSRGLLGRTSLDADEGMWFDGCSAIHTMGMRMTIDVAFIDRDGVVVRVAEHVRPWRLWVGAMGARDVLELAAGACARLGIVEGSKLEMQWASPT